MGPWASFNFSLFHPQTDLLLPPFCSLSPPLFFLMTSSRR